ncbi:GrpB family protein [Iodidimonas sp. SYSU 1G8]|uniref:GrpB family protein n=1 Tax=Iodidimonas sp. SYSU 1G8 TaxID=3133967 RepID=UPI0031FF04CD
MREPAPHDVHIAPYDPEWPALAAFEAARLTAALTSNLLRTEHMGSTSVPGLAAKPIVDLLPVVASLEDLDWQRPRIEALGYDWFGAFGIEGRRFCILMKEGRPAVHLHFFQQDSPQIARHLIFRDYLRAHPDRARAYDAEKRRAAALHPQDSMAYNREKWDWVAREEARALAWAGRESTSIA